MRLRTKLIISFLLITAILSSLGIINHYILKEVDSALYTLSGDIKILHDHTEKANILVLKFYGENINYLLYPGQNQAESIGLIEEYSENFYNSMAELKKLKTDKTQLIDAISAEFDVFVKFSKQNILENNTAGIQKQNANLRRFNSLKNAILADLSELLTFTNNNYNELIDRAHRQARLSQQILLPFIIIAVIFSIIFSFLITRSLTRPIRRLISNIKEIESGNYQVEAPVEGKGELSRLTSAFNHMVNKLNYTLTELRNEIKQRKKTESVLREKEEMLRAVFESTDAGILVTDINKQVTHFNYRFTEMWKIPLEQMAAGEIETHLEYGMEQLLDKESFLKKIRLLYKSAKRSREVLLFKDDRVYELFSSPLLKENQPVGRVWNFNDVTKRIQALENVKKSEQNYRNIFNSTNDAILIHTIDTGKIIDVNQTACDMYKMSYHDIISGTVLDLSAGFEPYSSEGALTRIHDAYRFGAQKFDWLAKDKNGQLFWAEINLKLAMIGDQERIIAVVRDISDRKKAEEAIKESEERYRGIYENATLGIYRTSIKGDVLMANPALVHMLGYDSEEDLKKRKINNNSYNGNYKRAEFIKLFDESDEIRGQLSAWKKKDGSILHIRENARAIRDNKNKIIYFEGTVEDITQQKRYEDLLKYERNLFRSFLDYVPHPIYFKDLDSRFVEINRAKADQFGLKKSDLIGKTDLDFYPKKIAELCIADEKKIMRTGQAIHIEEKAVSAKGNTWFYTVKAPRYDENSNIIGTFGISIYITEQKELQFELNKLRNLLSNIINSMPSVLIGVDTEGRVTQWNRQAELSTGIQQEKAIGTVLDQVMPRLARELNNVNKAIKTRSTQFDSKVAEDIGGEIKYSDITVYPLITNGVEGAVIRVDDVTDRVRIEEMMIQSEKMLTVGGLAAGMAHEINNPLAGMLQNAQVVLNRLSASIPKNESIARSLGTDMSVIKKFMEERDIIKMLNLIQDAGKRAAKIVENMLSFSRKSESGFIPVKINELLIQTVELAANDYDLKKKFDFRKIAINYRLEKKDPFISCDKVKIQQVLLNLLKNAAQALMEVPDQKKPQINIRTKKENKYLKIEIEDNGPGMEESIKKRIFEPFFTTKPVGVGTGLGLSVSYFIVTENHSGSMMVESSPGAGANFIIRLPISDSKK
ncbi:MAG: PAS domain S-box protein [Calditrichaceae bacterium]|nr:PAS domain S-box protein [Calditrichaceae bacterium]